MPGVLLSESKDFGVNVIEFDRKWNIIYEYIKLTHIFIKNSEAKKVNKNIF